MAQEAKYSSLVTDYTSAISHVEQLTPCAVFVNTNSVFMSVFLVSFLLKPPQAQC